jgi:Queuine tRNA-ribosyltransferase
MLKIVLEAPCGQRKAQSLRFLLQTRRFFGAMLPPEVSPHGIFMVNVPETANGDGNARLGELAIKGRKVIQTPNYLAVTSRGVVPHITPDVMSQHTGIGGVHVALEDCKFQWLWPRSVYGTLSPYQETQSDISASYRKSA